MTKQIIILLILTIQYSSWGQKSIVTDGHCTDAMAHEIKGRWIQTSNNGSHNSKETNNRLNEIHDMVLKMYPQPKGLDAVWHRTAGR